MFSLFIAFTLSSTKPSNSISDEPFHLTLDIRGIMGQYTWGYCYSNTYFCATTDAIFRLNYDPLSIPRNLSTITMHSPGNLLFYIRSQNSWGKALSRITIDNFSTAVNEFILTEDFIDPLPPFEVIQFSASISQDRPNKFDIYYCQDVESIQGGPLLYPCPSEIKKEDFDPSKHHFCPVPRNPVDVYYNCLIRLFIMWSDCDPVEFDNTTINATSGQDLTYEITSYPENCQPDDDYSLIVHNKLDTDFYQLKYCFESGGPSKQSCIENAEIPLPKTFTYQDSSPFSILVRGIDLVCEFENIYQAQKSGFEYTLDAEDISTCELAYDDYFPYIDEETALEILKGDIPHINLFAIADLSQFQIEYIKVMFSTIKSTVCLKIEEYKDLCQKLTSHIGDLYISNGYDLDEVLQNVTECDLLCFSSPHFSETIDFNHLKTPMNVSIFDFHLEEMLDGELNGNPKGFLRLFLNIINPLKKTISDETPGSLIRLTGAIGTKVPFLTIYNQTVLFVGSDCDVPNLQLVRSTIAKYSKGIASDIVIGQYCQLFSLLYSQNRVEGFKFNTKQPTLYIDQRVKPEFTFSGIIIEYNKNNWSFRLPDAPEIEFPYLYNFTLDKFGIIVNMVDELTVQINCNQKDLSEYKPINLSLGKFVLPTFYTSFYYVSAGVIKSINEATPKKITLKAEGWSETGPKPKIYLVSNDFEYEEDETFKKAGLTISDGKITPSENDTDNKKGLSLAVIIGIAVGGVVLVSIIIAVAIYFVIRYKKRHDNSSTILATTKMNLMS